MTEAPTVASPLVYDTIVRELHEPRRDLEWRLVVAIGLAVGIATLEILGSWLSHSLALLSEAGHMGTDGVALGLSLGALRLSRRPHTSNMSFGYHRMETLAALANAVLLIGITAFLTDQAYLRYLNPPVVETGIMFVIGVAAVAANLLILGLVRVWAQRNINARGVSLHAYGDALSSTGVVVASVLIAETGIARIDVVVSVGILGLILVSALRLLAETIHIILEASPAGIVPEEVAGAIVNVPGVEGVHDLHIWTVTPGLNYLTGHVLLHEGMSVEEAENIVGKLRELLRSRFGIFHITIQVEQRPTIPLRTDT